MDSRKIDIYSVPSIAIFLLVCAIVVEKVSSQTLPPTECNHTQRDKAKTCASFYPQKLNGSSADSSLTKQPLFASNSSVVEDICHSLNTFINCSKNLDGNTLGCLPEALDFEVNEAVFRYLCLNLKPQVQKPEFEPCWKSTTTCKFFHRIKVRQISDRLPGYCSLLNGMQVQLECALDSSEGCRQVPQSLLRQSRSRVSTMISDFGCDIEPPSTNGHVTDLPTRKVVAAENSKICSDESNKAANLCLKELWGLDSQIAQMFNASFLAVVVGNDTQWRSLCFQIQNHQKCLRKGVVKTQCVFNVEMHNAAIFLGHFCSMFPGDVGNCEGLSITCQEPAIRSDLQLMFSNNSMVARCALYESPKIYADCFKESKHQCATKLQRQLDHFSDTYSFMTCRSALVIMAPELDTPDQSISTNQSRTRTSSIFDYSNCTSNEMIMIEQCGGPFNTLIDELWNISNKNLITAIVHKLKEVASVVKRGCQLRPNFQQCAAKSVKKTSACTVMSCSVKVGEIACREETSVLEKDIRCTFSLFSTSAFQQCLKIFPKESLVNFASAKPYFSPFISCIEQPIRRKCGERSWRLARAFASNRGDSSCTLDFYDDSVWQAAKEDNMTTSATTPTDTTDDVELETTSKPSISVIAVVTSSETSSIITPVVWCADMQLQRTIDQCINGLGDVKPVPIIMFDDATKLDKACPLYSGYQNCLRHVNCTHPLAEAYKAQLYSVCTTYYDVYKSKAFCLKRAAYSTKVQTCLAKYQATNLRAVSQGLGQLGCTSVEDLLYCSTDTIDSMCGVDATNLVYDLYRPFARKFLPSCNVTRTDIAPEVVECSREDRNVYYQCRNQLRLNPINFFNDSIGYNTSCSLFQSTKMQKCFSNAPCLPQPAHEAFNDTINYLCLTEGRQRDFSTFGECMTKAANSDAGKQCTAMMDQMTWDDPSKIVCRKLNQAMDCSYNVLKQRCPNDSILFLSDVFSLMATRYRIGCTLNAPPELGTKRPWLLSSPSPEPIRATTLQVLTTTAAGSTFVPNVATVFLLGLLWSINIVICI